MRHTIGLGPLATSIDKVGRKLFAGEEALVTDVLQLLDLPVLNDVARKQAARAQRTAEAVPAEAGAEI